MAKNHIILGTILGLIVPLITLVVIYEVKFSSNDFVRFIKYSFEYDILEALVSLSGLPNLALFFLFIQANLYENAKGVILATFILVIIVILLKFII